MEMSSDEVFQFLDLFEKENLLWNPKNPLNKNRGEVQNSWARIHAAFPVECSITELKRKRDALMATFRPLLRRVKASLNNGSEDVFKPTWYAYERMAKFLIPIYDGKLLNNTVASETSETPEAEVSIQQLEINGDHLEMHSSVDQKFVRFYKRTGFLRKCVKNKI